MLYQQYMAEASDTSATSLLDDWTSLHDGTNFGLDGKDHEKDSRQGVSPGAFREKLFANSAGAVRYDIDK